MTETWGAAIGQQASMAGLALLRLSVTALLPMGIAQAQSVVWVVESNQYAESVRHNSSGWQVRWCGANGSLCDVHHLTAAAVQAVVGRADAVDLAALPSLALVQSASWYPIDGDAVPARAAIANFDIWPSAYYQPYSVSNLGEFVVAAIFDDTYRLAARAVDMLGCAFGSDAPARCPAASTATKHKTVSALTVGVLGYGRIGTQVATRMAALGATVVATKRHGRFVPPPAPLKWLSDDNDRLLRTADVVVVTAPGSAKDLINATSLSLMRADALLIPISAGSVDFDALETALTRRPALRAVLDVWPSGCWDDGDAKCGRPYGARDAAGSATLAHLPNVLPLPGLGMRDERFWAASAAHAASNLDALAAGRPLTHVVRNATLSRAALS